MDAETFNTYTTTPAKTSSGVSLKLAKVGDMDRSAMESAEVEAEATESFMQTASVQRHLGTKFAPDGHQLVHELPKSKGTKWKGEALVSLVTQLADITIGSNPDSHEDVPVYGFNCTKGWDPVTGVGTPRFGKMLAAAMQLP